ncbi:GPW/gp25 family protein [Celeribacter sp.]|uniref:GPW/gp25 family protein n=1 Tax=Celeribacter sp. TaxID=1890673 RepID=UPI003A930741
MSGMSRTYGNLMTAEAHLVQSIQDILTTPVGSRVMRPTYGSALPELIDAPMNGETLVDVFAATAEAIDAWEPRYELTRVTVASADRGAMELQLYGETDMGALELLVGVSS